MSDPLLLAEILSRATDAGGFTAHLALRALFVLLTQHGLEYPRFYPRLYSLLTPQLFQVIIAVPLCLRCRLGTGILGSGTAVLVS